MTDCSGSAAAAGAVVGAGAAGVGFAAAAAGAVVGFSAGAEVGATGAAVGVAASGGLHAASPTARILRNIARRLRILTSRPPSEAGALAKGAQFTSYHQRGHIDDHQHNGKRRY